MWQGSRGGGGLGVVGSRGGGQGVAWPRGGGLLRWWGYRGGEIQRWWGYRVVGSRGW